MPKKPINQATPAFLSWKDDGASKTNALKAYGQTISEAGLGLIHMTDASHRSFLDIETNRSVRPEYGRQDYDSFRPGSAVPMKQKDRIKSCMDAYERVGIIRNIIDLMGDFGTKGIKLVHPSKTVESFYQQWFKKVNGVERSERFMNTLYRTGNVIVKRRTAKLTKKAQRLLRKTVAAADMIPEPVQAEGKEVGWKYDFFNPTTLDIVGEEFGAELSDTPVFSMKLNHKLKNLNKKNNNKEVQHLISSMPKEVQAAINAGQDRVILPPDKTRAFYFKKDDWQIWANPIIYAILDDVYMLEKMKLADMSALDGAISNIRLWNLGDLKEKIMPNKPMLDNLRNLLASNVGGGTIDLVWGPELKFTESNTQVHHFLGQEKYNPVLTSIYAGLGVPPTLTGANTGATGGMTNNFVSLQTLLETLEYGRNIMRLFWEHEIEIVQKAMGFRLPATIHYDNAILSDKAAFHNLLIQLADRNIISEATLRDRFGELGQIEENRVSRQESKRDSGKLPPKVSPYHNPQEEDEKMKLGMTKDLLDPEQLGLPEMSPRLKKRKTEEMQLEKKKAQKPPATKGPVKKAGRPGGKKDSTKRATKRTPPRTNKSGAEINDLSLAMWADHAQDKISEVLHTPILKHFNKENMRKLTKGEVSEVEDIKLRILCNLEPFETIHDQVVNDMLQEDELLLGDIADYLEDLKFDFIDARGRHPSLSETRTLQSYAYVSACER